MHFKPLYTLLATIMLVPLFASAQITAPDTVCVGSSANISTTAAAASYTWVSDSFNINQGSVTFAAGNANLSTPTYATMSYDNGTWYSFVTNYGNNTITRLNFGGNPNGTFTSSNLPSVGLGSFIEGIDIVKDPVSGNWFGFVVSDGYLNKLAFGASLANTPTITTYNFSANMSWPHQFGVKKYGTEWVGFAADRNGTIVRFEFGTSINNTPTAVNLPLVGSMSNPCNFAIHQSGGNYYMFVTNLINATITRLDIGTNIKNTPTGTLINTVGAGFSLLRGIMLTADCNQLIAYIQNEGGDLTKLNFNNSVTNTSPAVTNMGSTGINSLNCLVPYVYGGALNALMLSFSTDDLYRGSLITFPASNTTTYYTNSTNLNFTTAGQKYTTLITDMGSHMGQTFTCKPLFVNNGEANVLRDTTICQGQSVTLSAASISGTGYLWSTGATTSSINVTTAGKYWVTIAGAPACKGSDTAIVSISGGPVVNLGNDTAICNGTGVTLQNKATPVPPGLPYLWNDASINPTKFTALAGKYWLRIRDASGCFNTDTIMVKVEAVPILDLGKDTSICANGSTILKPVIVNYATNYLWSTGATTPTLEIFATGKYYLTVSNTACKATDSITISAYPVPYVFIGNDTTICNGNFTLSANTQPSGSSYLWNTGSNSSSIIAQSGKAYVLTVKNSYGCSAYDSIYLSEMPLPYITVGPADTTLCSGEILSLPLGISSNGTQYLWQDGSTNPRYDASKSGIYVIQFSNACGTVYDTINITFKNCKIWFPSAFSPNGDGLNDIARLRGSLEDISEFSLSIYNRWGQCIFTTYDKYSGWDGSFNNKPLDLGAYYYAIYYKYNGKRELMKGDVTLVR